MLYEIHIVDVLECGQELQNGVDFEYFSSIGKFWIKNTHEIVVERQLNGDFRVFEYDDYIVVLFKRGGQVDKAAVIYAILPRINA